MNTIWRWPDGLKQVAEPHRLCLGVGNTPLVRSRNLGPEFGLANLYFKLESCNPTGSYKDRFAYLAISLMLAQGQHLCLGTTSGNTGSALAAHCAAAGIACRIAVVETAPLGKLQQMLAYGAQLFRVKRFGIDPDITSQVMEILKQLGARPDAALQISAFAYSPDGMTGVRTMAFELAEQSEAIGPLHHVFTPAGGGGLSLATAEAFQHLVARGRISHCPSVECVQPEGNDTIAGPLRAGAGQAHSVNCTTQISGLQVASVIDGHATLAACRATGGTGHLVSDAWVWEVQKRLAREEGVFCEPAGAAATAAALQASQHRELDPEANIVAVVSGTGFKDPTSLEAMASGGDCPLIGVEQLEREVSREA